MAYEKQTWQTGETITAQKLNHMEDGIDSALIPVMRLINGKTNSTDALTAFSEGKLLYFTFDDNDNDSNVFHIITEIDETNQLFIYMPSNNHIICSFSNNIITITADIH